MCSVCARVPAHTRACAYSNSRTAAVSQTAQSPTCETSGSITDALRHCSAKPAVGEPNCKVHACCVRDAQLRSGAGCCERLCECSRGAEQREALASWRERGPEAGCIVRVPNRTSAYHQLPAAAQPHCLPLPRGTVNHATYSTAHDDRTATPPLRTRRRQRERKHFAQRHLR